MKARLEQGVCVLGSDQDCAPVAASSPGSESVRNSDRLINVERARLLAAFGIVAFHALPAGVVWRSVGYAGLPVFLIIFAALIMSHRQKSSWRLFVWKKFLRLMLPWFFWSAVFAAALYGKSLLTHDHGPLFPHNSFLIGSTIHLWYLPYAFLMALLIFVCRQLADRSTSHIFGLLLGLAGILAYVICSIILSSTPLTPPFPQWIFGFPAILLGLAIGQLYRGAGTRERACYYGLLNFLFVVASAGLFLADMKTHILSYGIGLAVSSAAFVWKGTNDRFTSEASKLTYGIYLMHPMFIFAWTQVMPISLVGIITVFVLSAVVTWTMQRTRLSVFV